MSDNNTDRLMRRDGMDGHMTAAVIACVLSVVFHIGAVYLLSDLKFNVADISDSAKPMDIVDPFNIIKVLRNESDDVKRPEALKDTDKSFTVSVPNLDPVPDSKVDESVIEPPQSDQTRFAGAIKDVVKPSDPPIRSVWVPRQEIVVIDEKMANDNAAVIPRKLVPRIERVANAPDIVVPVDRGLLGGSGKGGIGLPQTPVEKPKSVEIVKAAVIEKQPEETKPPMVEKPVKENESLFEEKPVEITKVKAIDRYLVPATEVYSSLRDFRYGYFRIEIKRAGPEILPVLPKDILFVQDSSASITDQRLAFCKSGLTNCLATIGPMDRFNVVSFKDKATACFPDWMLNKPEHIEKAKQFISALKSEGSTDIFSSMQDILKLNRSVTRPTIAMLITDGNANTGITRSSNIIGEFTKLNNGSISVFTMGTIPAANTYMLDLLGHCNKGGVFQVGGGKWGIPESMDAAVKEISRPVMSNVKFRFAAGSDIEVYPLLASNLYLDRGLVLYGRFPRGTDKIVFQAAGESGDTRCDMLFDISLEKAVEKGDKDIREEWAKQKVYYLIGEYTRNPSTDMLKEIKMTAKTYGIEIPYEGKF